MIFQHTIDNVLNGTKTQTRRIVKPGEHIGRQYTPYIDTSIPYAYLPTIFTESGYAKWALGKEYAAQPGRTQKGVARIRITRIRQEDVRNISDDDVRAEGFEDWEHFMGTWCSMHDTHKDVVQQDLWVRGGSMLRWVLNQRPTERYTAWVLDFEVVK